MRVLVVNAGSSSLKLRVTSGDGDGVVAGCDLPGDAPAAAAVAALVAQTAPGAVGHRVVHGGDRLVAPVRVDDAVVAELRALTHLAPLHQPAALDGIEQARRAAPGLPHVACFDTAFHAALPPAAATYALPAPWRERFGLRRFGFHGLAHAWTSRRAAERLGRPAEGLRVVCAHLGAGASLAAVRDGRSVDTTMGFTPLEGLVMATRSGTVDPGLVLWLQRTGGLTAAAVEHGLEHEAGLAGLSGRGGDLRAVLAGEAEGDPACRLAVDVYLHRLAGAVAAMAAALGGLDALVFSGGVGEHAPAIRARAVERLAFLGLRVDDAANAAASADAVVSPPGAPAAVLVVAAREELEIARGVRAVLAPGQPRRPGRVR